MPLAGSFRHWVFTLTVLLLSTTPARAEAWIKLEGVPERLAFPLSKGANLFVKATIHDAQVRSAWLGFEAGDAPRAAMTKSGEQEYTINLAGTEVAALLPHMKPEGELKVFAELADGTIIASVPLRYVAVIAPKRLTFDDAGARFTVYQREAKDLPGCNGYWRLWLGDITRGEVTVTVYDAVGKAVLGGQTMRQGDVAKLRLGEETYSLLLERLVNLAIGRDYAEFVLRPAAATETERIERFLEAIAHSDVVFLRGDAELTPIAFVDHIRAKWDAVRGQVTTLDEFVEKVASQSWESRRAYQVRKPDGQVVDAKSWMRKYAAMVPSSEKSEPDPSQPVP